MRRICVAEIADGGQVYGGHAYHDCLDTARAQNVPIVQPRAGTFILEYKRFRMLFTGDAGTAAEQRFRGEDVNLSSTVLKVGHHGSAYSSSQQSIEAVHPKYAIISVGRHNLFGHPAPSTIETLQQFGAAIYRTDEYGAITIVSDGPSQRIEAYCVRATCACRFGEHR